MILTANELSELRQRVAQKAGEKGVSVHWLKAQVNAALQAIEDRWVAAATQNALAADIEAAAPGVFTASEKRYLLRYWLSQAGERAEATL